MQRHCGTGAVNLVLHTYWRSGAAWRVRIALSLKGLDFIAMPRDLRIGAQRENVYLALNPQGMVPTLETDGQILVQSMAILEWLEEQYPQPALLPEGIYGRAVVRAMAQTIACDIHPLNNLRVLDSLRADLTAGEDQVSAWINRWITQGFTALETQIRRYGGAFAFGDRPTIADCCLIPQVYSARRFGVDLSPFPEISRVDAQCAELGSFQSAHAESQPVR